MIALEGIFSGKSHIITQKRHKKIAPKETALVPTSREPSIRFKIIDLIDSKEKDSTSTE